jgi:hypothetical protein
MRLWSFNVNRSAANKPLVPGHHPALDFQQRRMLMYTDRNAEAHLLRCGWRRAHARTCLLPMALTGAWACACSGGQ